MKPESPENDIGGADALGGSGARATSAPADSGSRARNSGPFLLPRPWPDAEEIESDPHFTVQSEPLLTVDVGPVATSSARDREAAVVPEAPRVAPRTERTERARRTNAPRVVADQPSPLRVRRRTTQRVTQPITFEPITPIVGKNNWLPNQDYWLADHQAIPRPKSRPLPRPKRFRRVSYGRSFTFAFVCVVGAGLIVGGMIAAGQITYQYFNTPFAIPKTAPATATATLAPPTVTATAVPVTVTPTDAQQTVTPEVSPEVPTVTP
jgi:hypothetical protein